MRSLSRRKKGCRNYSKSLDTVSRSSTKQVAFSAAHSLLKANVWETLAVSALLKIERLLYETLAPKATDTQRLSYRIRESIGS